MNWDDIKGQLSKPFPVDKIHWRVGSTNQKAVARKTGNKDAPATKGIALAYVDARDVMQRLDDACGANWQCKYPLSEGGLLICEIGLKVEGEWIWRANGAGSTEYEAEKGKASDAFKRAAVLFGIGQYLYSLPNEWVAIKQQGKSYVLEKAPNLPSWATPDGVANMPGKRVDKQRVQTYVAEFLTAIGNDDAIYMRQLGDELKDTPEHSAVWAALNTKQQAAIKTALHKLGE
jgi:hypothetical protein